MKEIILIIQLFFSNAPEEFRAHIPTTSIEECYQMAAKVMEVREWEGRKVIGIGAGCYSDVPLEHKS